jgi:nicotinamidase-related amidase
MRSDRNVIRARRWLGYAHPSRKATPMQTALLMIDVQEDYFPGGRYPLWNMTGTLAAAEAAIARARREGIAVIHVQHVAASADSPLFAPGSDGVRIHPRILAAAPDAPVVVKQHADAFHETNLAALLAKLGVQRLLVAGAMTQNCVTHTALSKAAERFDVAVLAEATTTVDPMIHGFAVSALRTRVAMLEGWARSDAATVAA